MGDNFFLEVNSYRVWKKLGAIYVIKAGGDVLGVEVRELLAEVCVCGDFLVVVGFFSSFFWSLLMT